MAKKKAARRSARLYDSDDDSLDAASTTSYDLPEGGEVDEEHDEESILEGYIDALYEKRASTREAGLKGLVAAFTSEVLTDYTESKYETLSQQFLGSVKRGSAGEVALAARALGLLAVTLGAGDEAEHILEGATPVLTRVAKSSSASAARIAALESLAMLAFISASDDGSTNAIMDLFWQISTHSGSANHAQKVGASAAPGAVRASALSGWTLLLSTVSTDCVGQREVTDLAGLLRDADTSVKTAAGEALALLHEGGSAYTPSGSDGEEQFSDSSSMTSAGGATEELMDTMRELSLQGAGKRRSKRERQVQNTSFREILSSIQDGTGTETAIKLKHGDTLRVTTWSQTVQLNALRKFLAEGFQKHLQENPLLHQIFGYEPRASKAPGFRSLAEKRLHRSPNSVASKARTQARTYSRAMSQAANQGHFDTSVDEEY